MKPITVKLLAACSCLLILHRPVCSQETVTDANSEMYGNPYLIKDWSSGAVKFTSGRVVTQFRLRFDCVRNQLLLQFQGSTFAAESKVKEFVLYTGSAKKKDSVVFRKGYPTIHKGNENTYYHVLVDDKMQLLRLISKNIVEEKVLISSNNGPRGRLEDDEKYYLLKDGSMIPLPAEKEEILKALPDKADALSAFINDNKLRFKTPQDFTLLAKKYIELQQ